MDITAEQVKQWLEILGAPTLGLTAFIVLILYREAVIHFLKATIDVVKSWIIKS